jgi:hypothetical protein
MRQEEALMRINPLRPSTAGRFAPERSAAAEGAEPSPRRDLVAMAPVQPASSPHLARPRPQAAFLAHLLAVAQHAPQTQEKRRAEPKEALNRYAAAGKAAPASPGRTLKRAV